MYENFVKLTDHFKTKGGKLIYMFNFPITLPEFYKVDQEQMDTLKAIVNSLQDEMPVAEVPDKKQKEDKKKGTKETKMKEISSKLRSGIKHQANKSVNKSSKVVEEQYFDCNVLDQLEGEYVPQPEEQNNGEELKMDQSLDIFNFISNMDIGNQEKKPSQEEKKVPVEEEKEAAKPNLDDMFNFDNF